MLSKPRACAGCPLQTLGGGFALTGGGGKHEAKILVVAEALGEDEVVRGEPLVGRAGQTWDRLVGKTIDPVLNRPLTRDDFLLANVVNCRPPGNVLTGASYEAAAIDHCRGYLEKTIREFKPRCILTLGNTPLRWFTGQWGIESLRGYVFETAWGPVVPTYHPSYIQRGKWNLSRVVQLDILKALEVARGGTAALHVDKAYELSPGVRELEAFCTRWHRAGRPPMAFDIETPKADESAEAEADLTFEDDASYQILMISLAFEPFKAISVPWIEPYISVVKEIFKTPSTFLVWNAKFDVPRLMASEVHFAGEVVDVMLAWHWLEPALPMGLKYVATFFCPDMAAWKLEMHKNFSWYNCADSDVLLRVFQGVRERLEAQGRWGTFMRHFVEFGKVLNKMTERGVKVDQEARSAAREHFSERFAGVVSVAQAIAPPALGTLSPKRGYVRAPKDLSGLVQIEVELNEQELARKRKELDRARQKAAKEAEKQKRKAQREEAKRAKSLGKKDAKRRKGVKLG
jgi:uracil-DNA glycosylase family 4